MHVDDYLLIKVQHSDAGTNDLIASASLASDHVRLIGPWEEGVTPILAPNKSAQRDAMIDALGFTINSHTKKISFPRVKVDEINNLLSGQWPVTGRPAKGREVLSMAGKLWKLTYVVRAGRYFESRMPGLTGLHNSRLNNKQNNTVELGREVHADLASSGIGR